MTPSGSPQCVQCGEIPGVLGLGFQIPPQAVEHVVSEALAPVRHLVEDPHAVTPVPHKTGGSKQREAGIDLAGATPQLLTEQLAAGAVLLVTMGCGEQCPRVPGVERDDWPLEDPAGLPIERVRLIRDDILGRVDWLLRSRRWRRATRPDETTGTPGWSP